MTRITLTNYAMPLIRYKIGDMGILTYHEECQCGCQLPILKSIEGRIDDVVITEDGKKIGRLDHIFKGLDTIKECQIIQLALTKFNLKLVKDSEFAYSGASRTPIPVPSRTLIPDDNERQFRSIVNTPVWMTAK